MSASIKTMLPLACWRHISDVSRLRFAGENFSAALQITSQRGTELLGKMTLRLR